MNAEHIFHVLFDKTQSLIQWYGFMGNPKLWSPTVYKWSRRLLPLTWIYILVHRVSGLAACAIGGCIAIPAILAKFLYDMVVLTWRRIHRGG